MDDTTDQNYPEIRSESIENIDKVLEMVGFSIEEYTNFEKI